MSNVRRQTTSLDARIRYLLPLASRRRRFGSCSRPFHHSVDHLGVLSSGLSDGSNVRPLGEPTTGVRPYAGTFHVRTESALPHIGMVTHRSAIQGARALPLASVTIAQKLEKKQRAACASISVRPRAQARSQRSTNRSCRLTLPSSGLAPASGSRPSFHSRPYAARLRSPLMSNVRPHESVATRQCGATIWPAERPRSVSEEQIARRGHPLATKLPLVVHLPSLLLYPNQLQSRRP
jgi:hypothetical protein